MSYFVACSIPLVLTTDRHTSLRMLHRRNGESKSLTLVLVIPVILLYERFPLSCVCYVFIVMVAKIVFIELQSSCRIVMILLLQKIRST